MEKHFKNRLKHPITILVCLPGFLILAIMFGTISWWFFGFVMHLNETIASWGGITIAVLFLLLSLLRIPTSPDYAITDKEVQILRKGKPVKTFPFLQYQITPHVMNVYSILPVTEQRSIFVQEGGQRKRRVILNLSRRDFKEFCSLLEQYTKN